MITIKDMAEYFQTQGLWVMPSNLSSIKSEYSPGLIQQDVTMFDWNEADGIKCVLAKKGVAAIVLCKFKKQSERYNYNFVQRVLHQFGLDRYPWVIRTPDKVIILVMSGYKPNQSNIYTRAISLYLTGYVYLPFEDSSNQFYFNGVPTISLEYISIARLLRCFKEVAKDMSWTDYFSEVFSFNDFVSKYGHLTEVKIVRHSTKCFKLCIFEQNNIQTSASLYSGIAGMTYDDIIANRDNLKIGCLLNTHRFTVFKDWHGWENVTIEENLDINKPVPVYDTEDPIEFMQNYYDLHGLWHDEEDNYEDTPEDIEEMDKISDEIAREQDIIDEEKRKREIEKDADKRRNENLYDFSGDDSSLNPAFW